MLHLTAAFRPWPPHERFTTGTCEGAWSNLNTGLPVYTTKMTILHETGGNESLKKKSTHNYPTIQKRKSEHRGGNSNS